MIDDITCLLAEGKRSEAEKLVARMVSELSEGMESGAVIPQVAGSWATALFIRLTEHQGEELSAEAYDLVLEAQAFHDYGTKFGPDIQLIQARAKQVLTKVGNPRET